ncbi:MAG: B12-binding domain-containing radical SAM protein [Deltaproteobacteria bacterium]|nr:B12-binding domain-containing radical SAM protein [Deltaproteobacteria bacterium]MBW2179172.1 B12-binding domain-containing radical SAM protein [Deltaproteobacteria bacterium]
MSTVKNILLVYPEVPTNTYWSFKYALKFLKKKSAMPPLGLITLAALFPENYNLRLIDMNIEPLNEKDIQWADAVFVSAMIIQKESLKKVIADCNRLKTPVVSGGPYATSSYQEIDGVDHFVLGEVEDTFKNFLQDLEKGNAKKIYRQPERPDITSTVTPRFDLLDMNAYSSMSIQYSRGCPFKCEFCDIWKVYGNKPRVKSAETVIRELDVLYQSGWEGPVFMVDDNFIGNKKHVKKELLPVIIEWQIKHGHIFRFTTEASINIADDNELLAQMRDAGFNQVFIGIETPSTEALKETGKFQNLKIDMVEAIQTVQEYSIEVMAGFIIGFDTDKEDIFDRQISFIQQTGIPQAMVGLLNALPGTELSDRMEREGRLLAIPDGNNTHAMATNFVPLMDSVKLKEGYKKVLGAIYDSNLKNYFNRCNKLLDNIKPSKHFQRQIRFDEIRMLLKSVFRQPFTAYGFQYIKFVLRNILHNRDTFAEAIRFCIIGHHFHTITQETLKIEKVASDLEKNYNYFRDQINQYSQTVLGGSKDALHSVADLWYQRRKTLKKMRNKIDKIHVDFQQDISGKYAEVALKLNNLFKKFEYDLIKNGMIA